MVLDSPNYRLRLGKNVVRKLLFESFREIGRSFDLATYRYVGFGSFWFVDFILAHKVLRMVDLVSIEKDDRFYRRALANKPYSCINVEHGDSNLVLQDLDLQQKPLLTWLDYTSGPTEDVFDDLDIVSRQSRSGSLLAVTVNAETRCIQNQLEQDEFKDPDAFQRVLEEAAGNAVPETLSPLDITTKAYPLLLAQIVQDYLISQVRKASGDENQFVPILTTLHKDGARMLTVMGAIVNEGDKEKLDTSGVFEHDYIRRREIINVGIPDLTPREKSLLDSVLPKHSDLRFTPQESWQRAEEDLGVALVPSEWEAYTQFYRFYPVYYEVHE